MSGAALAAGVHGASAANPWA